MRRLRIFAFLFLCAGALSSCAGNAQDYRGDSRLRRRAGAFYCAWVRGDCDTAARFLSHNFHSNDPGLGAFRKMVKGYRLRLVKINETNDELKMKRLAVEITASDGTRREQVTYWIFERGDWYLEVMD